MGDNSKNIASKVISNTKLIGKEASEATAYTASIFNAVRPTLILFTFYVGIRTTVVGLHDNLMFNSVQKGVEVTRVPYGELKLWKEQNIFN